MKSIPPSFDPNEFLAKVGGGRTISKYRKNEKIFSQGDIADAVFYIQKGKVKITIISEHGKEAVIAILGKDEFAGEGCLAGQRLGVQMLKVLIAEDELLIADALEETLVTAGYEVCGIARTVDEAVALCELHKPDLAVLDVRLARGGRGPEIVQRLSGKGKCGILYATGDDARISTLTQADGEASIAKPYRTADVVRAPEVVREIVTGGTVIRPFPPGFRLLPASSERLALASRA